jgi:predicted ATP-dependent protease
VFFEQFFLKRGEDIQPNHQHEVMVKCPFEHDKGFETQASASFNTKKRIFKCFACTAEDRERGMGETSFIAKIYDTTYDNAARLKDMQVDGDIDNLGQLTSNLLGHAEYKSYLNARGITDEAIIEYKLGYAGDGIIYPVILNGIQFDTRTYAVNPDEGEPKIRSRKNSKPLLFPYDAWINDERDTLLTAGENDTILTRLKGFNAIETTLGEGSVPQILLQKFKSRRVYVIYDCDEAGRKSAQRIAFYLKDVGAEVYIIDLGLTGTKDDKDLTDYFIHNGKTAEDLQALIDNAHFFTQDEYMEQKNKEFELVDLWNVKHSKYSDKYISSRVMQMGHFELPIVDIPSNVEWECRGEIESKICAVCPFHVKNNSGSWSLDSNNLGDLLKLVEVDEAKQLSGLRNLCGIPGKCPNSRLSVTSKKHVEKVILSPDVETESEMSGFRAAELHAYILDGDTEDGNKYRMYFKRVPHPKDQSIMLVVDKVEESDNAINAFKVTDDFRKAMIPWQGNPYEVMQKRYEVLGKAAVGKYLPESIFFSSEIVYHSVLDFKFLGSYMKGHPEGLIVGASRTGKSEVGNVMSNFYGLGNVTECKNASSAGLIGGVEKSSNGTYRISWGEIPRNHKGMLFLDEISGLHPEVFKNLTGLRSQRIATIAKITKGKAPAKTRLLWVGNPKTNENGRSRSLYDYASGVDVCLDLFPADEDISRFDFIVLVPEPDDYISPLNDDGSVPEEQQLPDELKQLIRWAWSRTKDQVKFDKYVEKYIESVAMELNKDFGSSVKIIGIEGTKKIARIATSIAACCYSTDSTGDIVVVKKEHVDWVKDFLISCYDNDIFRLKQFVVNERKFSTTNDEVNLQVAGLAKKYPMIIKILLEQQEVPHYNLQAAGGIAGDEYRYLTTTMFASGLVTPTSKGIQSTRRLRMAVDALKNNKIPKKKIDTDKPRSFSDKINLK